MTAVVSREHAKATCLTGAAGVLMLAVAFVMMVLAAPARCPPGRMVPRSSSRRTWAVSSGSRFTGPDRLPFATSALHQPFTLGHVQDLAERMPVPRRDCLLLLREAAVRPAYSGNVGGVAESKDGAAGSEGWCQERIAGPCSC